MADWPEHEKLAKVSDQTQAIGEFIEWLEYEKGIRLMRLDDHGRGYSAGNLQELLAEWAEIDLGKLEAEKREMLERIRS